MYWRIKDSCERIRVLNLPVEVISFSDFGSPLLYLVNDMCSVAEKDDASIISPVKIKGKEDPQQVSHRDF